jgi:maltooligosyltrehalose trehalohydrolase
MERDEFGYWMSEALPAPAGTRYGYYLNGNQEKRYPDPASRYQPDGVHGPSEVIDLPRAADTRAAGKGLGGVVIYELHIGTFTPEGTLMAAAEKLGYLRDLGVNTIEVMPLNQTPGERNWGYDGVHPFALQRAYGRPEDLRAFISAAHDRGIAVLIDVIYNHLGPEGNYLPQFFPVFTDQHKTPWGSAINFDDRRADGVRNYWLENVKMWLSDYGADGLRLDAVHAIKDYSAEHFLEAVAKVAEAIEREQGREIILLAECDLNAPRYVRPREQGGYGMDGQWVDEFHHALHTLLTGESRGYYEDFGGVDELAAALRYGYVYRGQYSAHRQRNFGTDDYLPGGGGGGAPLYPYQFVVFLQNHDQVGNRMTGDRLIESLSTERYLLGAGVYLFSPFTPLIFMGEEYGERNPFPYFVHHGDKELIEAVRRGRAAEFAAFQEEGKRVPDPQSEDTFRSAKLSWDTEGPVAEFYRSALHLRAAAKSFSDIRVEQRGSVLIWWVEGNDYRCYANFGTDVTELSAPSDELLLTNQPTELTDGTLRLPADGFAVVRA